MAIIKQLSPVRKERHAAQSESNAGYSSFRDERDGRLLLQIDMWGSIEREQPEKVSQVVTMDESIARQLVAVIHDVFDLNSAEGREI